MTTKIVSADIADATIAATDLAFDVFQDNTVQAADVTIAANYGAVIVDEYVMDATHELIFSDPSEMVVI